MNKEQSLKTRSILAVSKLWYFNHFCFIYAYEVIFYFCCSGLKWNCYKFSHQLDWICISHVFFLHSWLSFETINATSAHLHAVLKWPKDQKIADDKHANLIRFLLLFMAHVCVSKPHLHTKKHLTRLINTSILADISPQHIIWINDMTYFFHFFPLFVRYVYRKIFVAYKQNTLNLLYFLKTVCCSCHTTWHAFLFKTKKKIFLLYFVAKMYFPIEFRTK